MFIVECGLSNSVHSVLFMIITCLYNWHWLKSHGSLLIIYLIYVYTVHIYVQRKDSLNIYCLKNLSHVKKTYVIIACAQSIESEVRRESD